MNYKNNNMNKTSYVTIGQLRTSPSSYSIGSTLMVTGQLTENYVEFANFIPGITLYMSLIYKYQAPNNLDVQEWYENKPYHLKLKISNLMHKLALDQNFLIHFLNNRTTNRQVRLRTTDPVNGEHSDIIGYYFRYEYQK